jgi:MFS family permease
MFAGFVLVPQLAQLPESTGFGLGTNATVAGLLMLPSTLMMLFSAPFSGRFGARHGSKGPLIVGALMTSVALFAYAAAHGSAPLLLLWGALQGAGIGAAFAAMPNLIIENVSQHQTGEATAVNTLLRNVGAAIGSQIAGTVLASHVLASTGSSSDAGFTLAFVIAGAAGLLAGLIATRIPRKRRAAAAAAAGSGATAEHAALAGAEA